NCTLSPGKWFISATSACAAGDCMSNGTMLARPSMKVTPATLSSASPCISPDPRIAPHLLQRGFGLGPAADTETAGCSRACEVGDAVVMVERQGPGAVGTRFRHRFPAAAVDRILEDMVAAVIVLTPGETNPPRVIGHKMRVVHRRDDRSAQRAGAHIHASGRGYRSRLAVRIPYAGGNQYVVGVIGNRRDEFGRAARADRTGDQ